MAISPFRRPSDMKGPDEKRVPASTRIKSSTKTFLEKEAKKNRIALAELLSNVIEDYATWLSKNDSGK